jgi:hypothetical protein
MSKISHQTFAIICTNTYGEEQDREAITTRISGNITCYIYTDIVRDVEHDDGPTWCMEFVFNLKFVVPFKQWHHTLLNKRVLEQGDTEEYNYILLYRNNFLVKQKLLSNKAERAITVNHPFA